MRALVALAMGVLFSLVTSCRSAPDPGPAMVSLLRTLKGQSVTIHSRSGQNVTGTLLDVNADSEFAVLSTTSRTAATKTYVLLNQIESIHTEETK